MHCVGLNFNMRNTQMKFSQILFLLHKQISCIVDARPRRKADMLSGMSKTTKMKLFLVSTIVFKAGTIIFITTNIIGIILIKVGGLVYAGYKAAACKCSG